MESAVITGHTLKLNGAGAGHDPLDVDAATGRGRGATAESTAGDPAGRHLGTRTALDPTPPTSTFVITCGSSDHVACVSRADMWRIVSALMSEHLDRSPAAVDVRRDRAAGRWTRGRRGPHPPRATRDGIAGVRFLDAVLWDAHPDVQARAGAPPGAQSGAGAPRSHRGVAHAGRRPSANSAILAQRSPFDRPITIARELAFTVAPLLGGEVDPRLAAFRATVNDVFLAVITGGLRHLARRARDAQPITSTPKCRSAFITATRAATELGNRDSFMNVDLPLGGGRSARPRFDRIRAETSQRKRLDDAEENVRPLPRSRSGQTPRPAPLQRISKSGREFSVTISNVPGPRVPVGIAGRGRGASLLVVGARSSSRPAHLGDLVCGRSGHRAVHRSAGACPTSRGLADAIGTAYAELRNAADVRGDP